MHHYVVVLAAESDARFRDEALPLRVNAVPTPIGNVDLIFRTRYSEEGFEAAVPREMWIDARAQTPAELPLSEVVGACANAAAGLVPMIALSTNAWVGDVAPKLAYDATPGITEREYFQNFVREERGTIPPTRRLVDAHRMTEMLRAIMESPERERLMRAGVQYALALNHWTPGNEIMTLAHLFIGMEALTPVALRRQLTTEGLQEEDELAALWGIEERRKALRRNAVRAEVRRRVLFRGDTDTATKARQASDGLEHSFMDFPKVRELAGDVVTKTGRYLREAIFELSELDPETMAVLASEPFDQPLRSYYRRYMWGKLVGVGDELATPEEEYPSLMWQSRLKTFTQDRDDPERYVMEPEETMTVRIAAGIQFHPRRWEILAAPASGAVIGDADDPTVSAGDAGPDADEGVG